MLCKCGCNRETNKGRRFIFGHSLKIKKNHFSGSVKGKRPDVAKRNKINPIKEDKHYKWKGDDVGYQGIHAWVRKYKPKSMFCEKCGRVTDKLDASNISGTYKRDISDFRWLCRLCHRREDIRRIKGEK